jgi:hypothetical protein
MVAGRQMEDLEDLVVGGDQVQESPILEEQETLLQHHHHHHKEILVDLDVTNQGSGKVAVAVAVLADLELMDLMEDLLGLLMVEVVLVVLDQHLLSLDHQ